MALVKGIRMRWVIANVGGTIHMGTLINIRVLILSLLHRWFNFQRWFKFKIHGGFCIFCGTEDNTFMIEMAQVTTIIVKI